MRANRPLVMVLGCIRTGTSTVARILHENLGICLGHAFSPFDDLNPEGYYEDILTLKWSSLLCIGGCTPNQFKSYMEDTHRLASCKKPVAGIKHPRLSVANSNIIKRIAPYKIIVTNRQPAEAVIKSIMTYTRQREEIVGYTEESATELYRLYMECLAEVKDKHVINIGPGRTPDSVIEEQLREILK